RQGVAARADAVLDDIEQHPCCGRLGFGLLEVERHTDDDIRCDDIRGFAFHAGEVGCCGARSLRDRAKMLIVRASLMRWSAQRSNTATRCSGALAYTLKFCVAEPLFPFHGKPPGNWRGVITAAFAAAGTPPGCDCAALIL